MITNDTTEVRDDAQRITAQPSRMVSHNSGLIFGLLLALGTLVLYNPALQNDFVTYDDSLYVFLHTRVLSGLSWNNIQWAFTTTSFANWHPLTWISHMATSQIFGKNPMGHHLVNVFLHTLNVTLLFVLLRKITGYTGRSVLVAALFAVHPLNVESVAWVSERKGLLCTFFVLVTLFAYVRYVRRPGLPRYMWVVFFFAMALMAKPLAVTLPLLLLLFDLWPLERLSLPGVSPSQPGRIPEVSLGRLLREKLPLAIMSAGSAAITLYAQAGGGATEALVEVPLRYRIGSAIYSYVLYLFKAVWPAKLAVFYPHPERSLGWWKVAVAAMVLLLISAAVWHGRKRKFLVAGWLWFTAALAPMAGFVQVGRQAMADRYAYIPLIGIFIMVVWLAADLTERSRTFRNGAIAVSAIALCAFAWKTHQQIGYWRDTVTLFTHSIEVTGPNYIAEDNLTWSLDITSHSEAALPHALAAVRMAPQVSVVHSRLADVLFHLKRFDEAINEYHKALSLSLHPAPDAWVHSQLGRALEQTNRLDEALKEFSIAISLDPGKPYSYWERGYVEYQMGQLDAAAADFNASLRLKPDAAVYYWMGRTMEDKNDLRSAIAAYELVLRGDPQMSEARARIAALQARLSR